MTPPRVAELNLAAADYVRRAVHLELDGSVESLAYLDHYLASVGRIDDHVLSLVAAAVGAYFGELIVEHLGGTWRAESEDPAEWMLTLASVPLTFRPVALAAEALRHGEAAGYDARLVTLDRYDEELADALASAGPVEEDYYYSLTGRYETIEHAAAILAELQRRSDGADADAPGGRRPN